MTAVAIVQQTRYRRVLGIGLCASLVGFGVVSCGSNAPTDSGGSGPRTSEKVIVIDTVAALRLSSVDDASCTFVLSGPTPVLPAGAIIVGSEDHGFLRTVVSTSITDTLLTVTTSGAVLTDAVIDGGVTAAFQLPLGEEGDGLVAGVRHLVPQHLAKGVTVVDGAIDLSGLEMFNGEVAGTDLSVDITSGSLAFTPSIDVGFTIAGGDLTEYHSLAGGALDVECELTMTASGPVTYEREMHLATFESVVKQMIGDIPVIEVITLRFDAGFNVSASDAGTVRYSSSNDFDLLLGGRTHEDGWLAVWNPKGEYDGELLTWPGNTDVSVTVDFRPQVTIAYYGVAGPALAVNPSVEFVGNMEGDLNWNWSLSSAVDGRLDQNLQVVARGIETIGTEFAALNETIVADSGVVALMWERAIGGALNDEASDVVATRDGGFAVVGTTHSFGAGGSDIYLVKLDAEGGIEWEQTYGGSATDNGESIVELPDGSFVIGAETQSFGAGDNQAWVIKTDAAGETIWTSRFGIEVDVRGLAATTDGGFILTGRGRLKLPNSLGLYLAKLSANGNVEWQKTFPSLFTGADVIEAPAGGFIVTGYAGTENYADLLLLKTDASGNDVWIETFGGYNVDFGSAVVATEEGGYLALGSSRSFGGSGLDMYLVKSDQNGVLQWSRNFRGNDDRDADDIGRDIAATGDGGHILVGRADFAGNSFGNIFIVKINAFGIALWQRTIGGEGLDDAHAVSLAQDGGFIIAGRTDSFGAGGTDMYVIKTDRKGLVNGPISGKAVAQP